MKETDIAGIVLAAGQGKRMESTTQNKVTEDIGGKPMVLRTVELLRSVDINQIVIVVGFQKESVINIFEDSRDVIFAEQLERKGTAHAVQTALKKIEKSPQDVIILQGDDSIFYTKDLLYALIKEHRENKSSLTFLTINTDNPAGLGRILRDKDDQVIGIVEEKDATDSQLKINEINPACYVVATDFLSKYLKEINPSPVTGEYYLTSLIDIGLSNKEKIHAHRAGKIPWRGVNTKEELDQAKRLFLTVSRKS